MRNLFLLLFFIFSLANESKCGQALENTSDESSEEIEIEKASVLESGRKSILSILEDKLGPVKTIFSQSRAALSFKTMFINVKRFFNGLFGLFSPLDISDYLIPIESIAEYESPDDTIKMLSGEMLNLLDDIILNSYKNFNTQLKKGNDSLYSDNSYKRIEELDDDMHFMVTLFLTYILDYGTDCIDIKTLLYKAFSVSEDVTTIGYLDFLRDSFKEQPHAIQNDSESIKKVKISKIANAMLHIKDEDVVCVFVYEKYSVFCALLHAIFPALKDSSSICYLQLFKVDWAIDSPQRQLVFPCYEYLRKEVVKLVEKYKSFEEICPIQSYKLNLKDHFLIPIDFTTAIVDKTNPTRLKERELDFIKFVYFLGLFVFMRLEPINPLSEKYNNMSIFIKKLIVEENCATLFTTVSKILKVSIKLIEMQNSKDTWVFCTQETISIDSRVILKMNKHLYLYAHKKCSEDSDE